MKTDRRGFTMIELLASIAIIAIIGSILIPTLSRGREEARTVRCRNNLRHLAMAMSTYVNACGDFRFYPFHEQVTLYGETWQLQRDMTGADFLAALYWSRIITDPGVFICPSTNDENFGGAALGLDCSSIWPDDTPEIQSQAPKVVSYASKGYRHMREAVGGGWQWVALMDPIVGETILASDDTESLANHPSGMSILYFDGRVEFDKDLDRNESVGTHAPLDCIMN